MKNGTYTNLEEIRAGLQVAKAVDPHMGVSIRTHLIHLPELRLGDITSQQLVTLNENHWHEHTLEGGFYYSLVEVAL